MDNEEILEELYNSIKNINNNEEVLILIEQYCNLLLNDSKLFIKNPDYAVIVWNRINIFYDIGLLDTLDIIEKIFPNGCNYYSNHKNNTYKLNGCTKCGKEKYGKWLKVLDNYFKFICWDCSRNLCNNIDKKESIIDKKEATIDKKEDIVYKKKREWINRQKYYIRSEKVIYIDDILEMDNIEMNNLLYSSTQYIN